MSLPRQARQATGLSQREFAQLVGVNHVTIAKWETGARTPSAQALSLLRLVEASPRRAVQVLRRAQREAASSP